MSGITRQEAWGSDSRGFVCFLANAGIFLSYDKKTFLIDGLHRGSQRFSGSTDAQIRDIISGAGIFRRIDCMLVTHDHSDHYDLLLTRRLLHNHPETVLISPVTPSDRSSGRLDQPEGYALMPDLEVHFLQLAHEGPGYEDVVNYGYDIRVGDFEFVVAGDAAVSAAGLAHLTEGRTADAAFINFPFLTLKAGRAVMKNVLRAKKFFVFHLPFEEDDRDNYRKSAFWAASKAHELGLPPTVLFAFPDTCVPLD